MEWQLGNTRFLEHPNYCHFAVKTLWFWLSCCAALLCCLCFVGCGRTDRSAVSGIVTLDGKPLSTGVINFFPTEGTKGPSAGGIIVDGRYEVGGEKGVMVGTNRVTISSQQKTGRKVSRFGRPGSSEGLVDEMADVVPQQYNAQSTLVQNIQAGKNELNFELQGRVPIESVKGNSPRN